MRAKELFKNKDSQTPKQITKSGTPELRPKNLNFKKLTGRSDDQPGIGTTPRKKTNFENIETLASRF